MKYTFTSRVLTTSTQEKELAEGDTVYYYEHGSGDPSKKIKGEVELVEGGDLAIVWSDGEENTLVGSSSFMRILPLLGLS